jgi:hypothetical protein
MRGAESPATEARHASSKVEVYFVYPRSRA